jgi:hypothetical protein
MRICLAPAVHFHSLFTYRYVCITPQEFSPLLSSLSSCFGWWFLFAEQAWFIRSTFCCIIHIQLFCVQNCSYLSIGWLFLSPSYGFPLSTSFPLVSSLDLKCFSSVFISVCDSCTSLVICITCAGNGGIFSWCVGARGFIWDTMTEILTSILCGWLLICVHVPGWVTNSSLKVYEWCRSDTWIF